MAAMFLCGLCGWLWVVWLMCLIYWCCLGFGLVEVFDMGQRLQMLGL